MHTRYLVGYTNNFFALFGYIRNKFSQNNLLHLYDSSTTHDNNAKTSFRIMKYGIRRSGRPVYICMTMRCYKISQVGLLSRESKEERWKTGSTHCAAWKDGPDGIWTRVRKPLPCPSTIIAGHLTFPLPAGDRHPAGFSSFMIRPYAQSLAYVVSHIVDAWVLGCECLRSDSSHQAASAKLSSAFIFRFAIWRIACG